MAMLEKLELRRASAVHSEHRAAAFDSSRVQEATAIWAGGRSRSVFAPLTDSFRLLVKDRMAVAGMAIIATLAVVGILGPLIVPLAPFQALKAPDGSLLRLAEPSAAHPFGTDYYAHSVLSQFILGIRIAFLVGLSAALAVGLISTVLGLVSGYFGGYLDDVIMRLVDIALSIPTLPFAIVMVAVLGPSLTNVLLVIVLLYWRNGARIVRSAVLTQKQRPFITAARALGASHWRIMTYHILPNVLPVAFLWMTMSIAFAVLTEASLSFIGLGDPNMASWGQMLNLAFQTASIRSAWWWVLPPSLGLILLISSIYFIGRAFEEQTNPRLRKRAS
jgi:peptide/nickel transport system permease protein